MYFVQVGGGVRAVVCMCWWRAVMGGGGGWMELVQNKKDGVELVSVT